MNYITTTELRTKSKQFVESLKRGESISLVHRSKILGKVSLTQDAAPKFDTVEFDRIRRKLKLPNLSYKQRERNYKEAMETKHGKGLSRH